jgi:hypothetical protein
VSPTEPSPEITELAYLLVRLEQAVEKTATGFKRGMACIALFFFVMAIAYGAAVSWIIAAFLAAFGVGMLLVGRAVARKTAPEKMRPVLDALRDDPARVEVIRHYQTSDSRRIFVDDWLELKTRDHRLIVKANDDWQRLLATLERRCPGATIQDGRPSSHRI